MGPALASRGSARHLVFSVREARPSNTRAAGIDFGTVTAQNPLYAVYRMLEPGAVSSDGSEADFLAFNSGAQAVVTSAAKYGCVAC